MRRPLGGKRARQLRDAAVIQRNARLDKRDVSDDPETGDSSEPEPDAWFDESPDKFGGDYRSPATSPGSSSGERARVHGFPERRFIRRRLGGFLPCRRDCQGWGPDHNHS